MARRQDVGVPATPSGYSPKGGAAKASPAEPSIPNAAECDSFGEFASRCFAGGRVK